MEPASAKPGPVMDVVTPMPADIDPKPQPAKAAPAVKTSASVKPANQRSGSILPAIIATVVIVLSLAALTVFAYLKQTDSL